MTVTQRGQLSREDERRMIGAREDEAEAVARTRALALELVAKSSYREVERLTGISTNTLQRWKREAQGS